MLFYSKHLCCVVIVIIIIILLVVVLEWLQSIETALDCSSAVYCMQYIAKNARVVDLQATYDWLHIL